MLNEFQRFDFDVVSSFALGRLVAQVSSPRGTSRCGKMQLADVEIWILKYIEIFWNILKYIEILIILRKSLKAGQKQPEVWDSPCRSTATSSEPPELAEVPGIWADGEYASFRWSPVRLDWSWDAETQRDWEKAVIKGCDDMTDFHIFPRCKTHWNTLDSSSEMSCESCASCAVNEMPRPVYWPPPVVPPPSLTCVFAILGSSWASNFLESQIL